MLPITQPTVATYADYMRAVRLAALAHLIDASAKQARHAAIKTNAVYYQRNN